jgi:hypothetical protein
MTCHPTHVRTKEERALLVVEKFELSGGTNKYSSNMMNILYDAEEVSDAEAEAHIRRVLREKSQVIPSPDNKVS